MAKKEKRFVVLQTEGALSSSKVLVDTKTGVNYLYHSDGSGGGLTVLVDRDGKPIVSRLPLDDE